MHLSPSRCRFATPARRNPTRCASFDAVSRLRGMTRRLEHRRRSCLRMDRPFRVGCRPDWRRIAAAVAPPRRARPARASLADRGGNREVRGSSGGRPMLDSRPLSLAVRRAPPTVEDLRATTVAEDPVQRRDLILLERAREGDLNAFNDLVVCYQDMLFALVVRMVPDRDQASDAVQEAFFSAYRNMGSVPRRERQVVAEPDRDQRRDGRAAPPEAPPVRAVPGARGRHLAAAGRRLGRPGHELADLRAPPRRSTPRSRRSPTTSGRRSSCTTSRATTTPRSRR